MHIHVQLYGDLKKYAPGGKNRFELIISPGDAFEDVVTGLSITDTGYVSLVNGRRINKETCFNEGDTLVLFPEISGG